MMCMIIILYVFFMICALRDWMTDDDNTIDGFRFAIMSTVVCLPISIVISLAFYILHIVLSTIF